MKNRHAVIVCALVACTSFLMQSCQKSDDITGGKVPVSFDLLVNDGAPKGGRVLQTETPARVQVTIEDDQGVKVLDSEIIELIPFGSSFASDPVELVPGNYVVTSFLVLNEGDTAIYASPLESSPSAQLVDDPLVIPFSVVVNEVTSVPIEVLIIDDATPNEFGYASFIPVFVATFKFEIVVFEKDTVNNVFNTTMAHLLVTSGVDTVRQDSLIAGINLIEVNDNLPNYTLHVTKTGFVPFDSTFTIGYLKQHSQVPGNTPLEVILVPGDDGSGGGPGGTTSGTFVDSGQRLTLDQANMVALGDLDVDGDLDIIISNGTGVIHFQNDGVGSFAAIPNTPQLITVTDGIFVDDFLDPTSGPEVLFARGGETLVYTVNNGTFSTSSNRRLTGRSFDDFDAQDLEGDGDLDFVLINAGIAGRVEIIIDVNMMTNNTPGLTGIQSTTFDGVTGSFIRFVDANDDGFQDLFVGSAAGTANSIYLNDGSNNFSLFQEVDFGGVINAEFGDLDSDGDTDIVLISNGLPRVWLNNGASFQQTGQLIGNGISHQNLELGDLDNDGDLDMFVVNLVNNTGARVFFNDGAGSFTDSGQSLSITGDNQMDVALGDLNGDGILDAVVTNLNGQNAIFFGQP